MALELKGKVSLDGSGFEAGINKMSEKLKEFALEAFGIYTVSEAIKKTVEYADELVDTANRIGISTKALQEFGFAARMTGSHMEELVTFVEKLNSSRLDPKKFGSFEKLGINQAELAKAPVEELIMKLSTNVQGKSSQEIIGPLRDVGGRGAGANIAMLKDNLEELREEAEKLGQVMALQDLVALKALADQFKILATAVLVGIAPAITEVSILFLRFIGVLKTARDFLATATRNVTGAEALQSITSPGRLISNLAKIFGNGNDAIIQASATAFNSSEDVDKLIAKLVKAQLDIEKVNATPEFQPNEEKPKPPRSMAQNHADSLIQVGNFLGSSKSTLENVGERQLKVLHIIERNTRPRNGLGGQFLDSTFAG